MTMLQPFRILTSSYLPYNMYASHLQPFERSETPSRAQLLLRTREAVIASSNAAAIRHKNAKVLFNYAIYENI